MSIQMEQGDSITVLRPEGEFNIYGAVEFRDVLLKALAGSGDLGIDFTAVSEIDAAGLQLLLLARREADTCGKRLHFSGAVPAVLEVVQLCNVSARLDSAPAVA
jgi:anti-sigma B factor antagonist